jgi:PadR family transcriptional regulator PadR
MVHKDHLTSKCKLCSLDCQVKKVLTQILQGTLDLMILRTLATMGPQHAYGIANRLLQISDDALNLNQGTIYPALVRLEQHGWTRGSWERTENNREAKYYTITKAGLKALKEETARWRQMAGVVEKLLAEEQ